jgi:hypothetical protein
MRRVVGGSEKIPYTDLICHRTLGSDALFPQFSGSIFARQAGWRVHMYHPSDDEIGLKIEKGFDL